jgi:hypothetical protein
MLFFSLPSWAVALIVFGIIGAATTAGYVAGRYLRVHEAKLREPYGVLQGALLGIVGLLLAFGLTLAIGRYEDRRNAIVTEANAIDTGYLRSQLLTEPVRTKSLRLWPQYADLALQISREVPDSSAMHRTTDAEEDLQRKLWRLAGEAVGAAPLATAPRLYVDNLNTTFDAQAARLSTLNNRVPSAVLVLELFGAAVALGLLAMHISILGRGLVAMIGATVLVTLLLLVIFDLDRPTRGVIKVPLTPLASVRAEMIPPPAAQAP